MIEETAFTEHVVQSLALGVAAFLLGTLITPLYTTFAYKFGWWKKERTHSTTGEKLKVVSSQVDWKRQVPTMAGSIMVVATLIITVFFNLERSQTWMLVASLIGGGIVGLIDDIINLRGDGTGTAGLKAPIKFGLMFLVGVIGAWFFYYKLGYSSLHVPFVGDWNVGPWLMPMFVLAILSTSNAVNISDGRDGLAGGLLLTAFSAFGIIASLQGNYGIAAFCFTVSGTLLSYVWFNIPPARFFMGDVGSFSLGTALGVVAMLTDTLLLLPIIGFVFVMEAGTSLLQILSKKLRSGKRIFIAAPIHHHFEALGWSKEKVTMRFWILGIMCAFFGILIALTGGY